MPEFCCIIAPESQRAQGKPDARSHPQPRVRVVRQRGHTSEYRYAETCRPSLRNVLRLIARSPRCPGLIATVTREQHGLDPSVGRSGPHAFAVRPVAARPASPQRPSQPALNVRDDAYAPPIEAGWHANNHLFLKNGSCLFSLPLLNRSNGLTGLTKSDFRRNLFDRQWRHCSHDVSKNWPRISLVGQITPNGK